MDRKINRIKVMLVDKGKTNRINDLVRFEALPDIPSPEEDVIEIN